MRKSLMAGLGALALGAAVALPAAAQTSVPVTLDNPAGTRAVYVEDMVGSSLQSLDFHTNRSMPFRVRVVDNQYGATPFSVNATMTNLYLDGGTFSDKIASSKVSLGTQLNPVAASGVSAVVQPVYNLASTVDSTICIALGLLPLGSTSSCTLNATGVVGTVQSLPLTPLANLSNLPLIPQPNETGAFTNAEYGAGTAGAGDPAASGAPAPTPRKVAQGGLDTTAIANLTSLVDTSPATDAVASTGIIAAFNSAYPALSTLLPSQLNTIVTNTVATAENLTLADVLNLTGTYISLPTLNVDTAGAPTGSFHGTLVVTAVQ